VVRHRLVKAIIRAYDREKDAPADFYPISKRPGNKEVPPPGNE
jgi:hypothetical protein